MSVTIKYVSYTVHVQSQTSVGRNRIIPTASAGKMAVRELR